MTLSIRNDQKTKEIVKKVPNHDGLTWKEEADILRASEEAKREKRITKAMDAKEVLAYLAFISCVLDKSIPRMLPWPTQPMYFLYIIGSIPTSRWYIGITEHTLKRLEQHNAGRTRSTKPYRPYKLIHEEKFTDKTEARKREIKVKRSGIIRKELKERLHGPIV